MKPALGEAYAAVYVSLPWHDKALSLPDTVRLSAFGFYVAALAFCQNHRTDGRVSLAQMPAVFSCSEAERARAIEALILVGLFDEEDGVIWIHDYLDHNRSRAEIEDARERMVKGGRVGGVKSGETRRRVGFKGGVEASLETRSEETSSEESRSDETSEVETCTWCVRDDGTHDPECPDCAGTGLRTS